MSPESLADPAFATVRAALGGFAEGLSREAKEIRRGHGRVEGSGQAGPQGETPTAGDRAGQPAQAVGPLQWHDQAAHPLHLPRHALVPGRGECPARRDLQRSLQDLHPADAPGLRPGRLPLLLRHAGEPRTSQLHELCHATSCANPKPPRSPCRRPAWPWPPTWARTKTSIPSTSRRSANDWPSSHWRMPTAGRRILPARSCGNPPWMAAA